MSEKFTSKQDRTDVVNSVKDFVTVDAKGNAHVPAGSGNKSGKFLSDHELKMIEAHASQIYDGMENKETESLLDAVGVLTDPTEIRDSLFVNGFLDDEEHADWTDEEVMQYVADKRSEVADYYDEDGEKSEPEPATEYVGKRRANVPLDSPSGEYIPRHRADVPVDNEEESTPIFDELNAQVREGESLEEFETRQPGKHRLEDQDDSDTETSVSNQGEAVLLSSERMRRIASGDTPTPESASHSSETLSSDRMRNIAASNDSGEAGTSGSGRNGRGGWSNRLTAGLAAKTSARVATMRERNASGEVDRRSKLRRRLTSAALLLVSAGVGAGATYLRFHGNDVSTNGGGGNFPDIFNFPDGNNPEGSEDGDRKLWGPDGDRDGDGVINSEDPDKDNDGVLNKDDFAPLNPDVWEDPNTPDWSKVPHDARWVEPGEGWYQTFQELGIPQEHWEGTLAEAGPELEKQGWAYFDETANEWRISQPGRLPDSALQTIADGAKRDDFTLVA